MKFYLASSFALKDTVQDVAEILENLGHSVTVKWWLKDYKKILLSDDDWYDHPDVGRISQRNFEGIRSADVFLFIADKSAPRKFNGANIEFGYAYALRKPCFAIGLLERSAMYVPMKRCSSLSEVLELVREATK